MRRRTRATSGVGFVLVLRGLFSLVLFREVNKRGFEIVFLEGVVFFWGVVVGCW